MGERNRLADELKRLSTKMRYALDMRDAVDSEARRLRNAIEEAAEAPELEERIKAAKELLKLLEKEREAMDELIKRANSVLDRLRSVSALRRFSAFFGGFLIFIGAVVITSGAFVLLTGAMSGALPPELEEFVGIASIFLGALLVLSGFIHQVPQP